MKIFKTAISAMAGLGIMLIAACSTGPASAQQQAGSKVADSYRLGAGDEVKITVFDEPTLSGAFTVDGQGALVMPLVGAVTVNTLSLAEAQGVIEAKLRDGYLKEPKVTMEMTKGRPYYILGEVTRAGEYPFTSGLTVMNAIAAAGDFTYRADKKRIVVTGADGVEREVSLTATTPVRPGDRIRIRERFF